MLTAKREEFAKAVAMGQSIANAYRQIYQCQSMSDRAVLKAAADLATLPEVEKRISELRGLAEGCLVKTAFQRLEWLSEIIDSPDETAANKLKAVEIMNKMQGDYAKPEPETKLDLKIVIELTD